MVPFTMDHRRAGLSTSPVDVSFLLDASGVVIGNRPEYVDAAASWGSSALNVPVVAWNFFANMGEAWTLNQSFLQMSAWIGQNFTQVEPSVTSGNYLQLELEYLQSIGQNVVTRPYPGP
jgi:hypothetical protein